MTSANLTRSRQRCCALLAVHLSLVLGSPYSIVTFSCQLYGGGGWLALACASVMELALSAPQSHNRNR